MYVPLFAAVWVLALLGLLAFFWFQKRRVTRKNNSEIVRDILTMLSRELATGTTLRLSVADKSELEGASTTIPSGTFTAIWPADGARLSSHKEVIQLSGSFEAFTHPHYDSFHAAEFILTHAREPCQKTGTVKRGVHYDILLHSHTRPDRILTGYVPRHLIDQHVLTGVFADIVNGLKRSLERYSMCW